MSRTVSNSDKIIDSRDIIKRLEELRDERTAIVDTIAEEAKGLAEANKAWDERDASKDSEEGDNDDLADEVVDRKTDLENVTNELEQWDEDNGVELKALEALNEEGESTTSEWTHGATLIREDHWVDYCQELCEEIGDMPKGFPSYIEIDWEKTAENLKQDYSQVTYDGETYYVQDC